MVKRSLLSRCPS